MTLEEAQKQVDQWIKTYGVRYFNELTNMAILTEEVGELARIMARTYGDQSFKEGEKHNLSVNVKNGFVHDTVFIIEYSQIDDFFAKPYRANGVGVKNFRFKLVEFL